MKYAGFWKRCAACWIDYVVVTLAICGVAIVTSPLFPEGFEKSNDPTSVAVQITIVVAVLLGIPLLYASLLESSKHQASLGKMLLRLLVVGAKGNRIGITKAVVRNVPKVLNLLVPPLYFLFLAIPISKKKQALHDKLARTFVVESETGKYTTTDSTLSAEGAPSVEK